MSTEWLLFFELEMIQNVMFYYEIYFLNRNAMFVFCTKQKNPFFEGN